MRRSRLRFVWLVILAIGCGSVTVPPSADQRGFVTHVYKESNGNESKDIVFVPAAYDGSLADLPETTVRIRRQHRPHREWSTRHAVDEESCVGRVLRVPLESHSVTSTLRARMSLRGV